MRRNHQLQQRHHNQFPPGPGEMPQQANSNGGAGVNIGITSDFGDGDESGTAPGMAYYNPTDPLPSLGGDHRGGGARGPPAQGHIPPPLNTQSELMANIPNFDMLSNNPMISGMAMAYGETLKSQGQETLNKWISIDLLRHYFAVDNSYVGRKIGLLLFPFLHKNWAVQCVSESGHGGGGEVASEKPVPPRLDVNSPDLYIPAMALVTYILCGAYALGVRQHFTPEVLGIQASTAIAWLIFEVCSILFAIYLMDIKSALRSIDLVAFCSYKFVGMNVSLLCGVALGSVGYYVSLAWCGVCMSYVLLRCLKPYVMSTATQQTYQEYSSKRLYVLFFIALLQPVLMHWLTKHLMFD